MPVVALTLRPGSKHSASELILSLQNGRPSIYANASKLEHNVAVFNRICLNPGEAKVVVDRL